MVEHLSDFFWGWGVLVQTIGFSVFCITFQKYSLKMFFSGRVWQVLSFTSERKCVIPSLFSVFFSRRALNTAHHVWSAPIVSYCISISRSVTSVLTSDTSHLDVTTPCQFCHTLAPTPIRTAVNRTPVDCSPESATVEHPGKKHVSESETLWRREKCTVWVK